MRAFLALSLSASLALAGCNSNLNPVNWFGSSSAVEANPEIVSETVNPLIPETRKPLFSSGEKPDETVLISAITEMRVDRTVSGAIIVATGLAPRQGTYEPELRPDNPELRPDENGVLDFTFRVLYPDSATPAGDERLRQITAAYSLSNEELEAVRVIRVSGAQNARETRRK